MPHLTNMVWDYKDELISASNGTVNSFYNYDAEGNRTRKVVVKPGGIIEERYYLDGYEVYRKYLNNNLDLERKTINVYDVKLFDKNNEIFKNNVLFYNSDEENLMAKKFFRNIIKKNQKNSLKKKSNLTNDEQQTFNNMEI